MEIEDYPWQSINGDTFFYCDECTSDAYFDIEEYECVSCTIIPNCESCTDSNHCTECAGNWILDPET